MIVAWVCIIWTLSSASSICFFKDDKTFWLYSYFFYISLVYISNLNSSDSSFAFFELIPLMAVYL